MSSLESVSETRTDLISYITDQLNNGVYKTRVKKVEVLNEITGEKEVRAQTEIITDANAPGGYKRQETSPFSQYGISCGLVSIIDIKYDKATQSQIDAQKQANLIEKETAIGIAEALANSQVRWVPEIIMNGNSSNGSAMDAVGLNMMMDIVKKMNKEK